MILNLNHCINLNVVYTGKFILSIIKNQNLVLDNMFEMLIPGGQSRAGWWERPGPAPGTGTGTAEDPR